DGLWLATASHDRSLNLYCNTGTVAAPVFTRYRSMPFKGVVESMCFLPSSSSASSSASASTCTHTLVAGIRDDNYLHYIDLAGDSEPAVTRVNLNANNDDWVSFTPLCLAPSPSGSHLLVYTDAKAGRLIIYQTRTSRVVRNLWGVEADGMSQPSAVWSPSGRHVFASSEDGAVVVYDAGDGRRLGRLEGHEGVIRSMVFDAEEHAVVTCSYDLTVRVWPMSSSTDNNNSSSSVGSEVHEMQHVDTETCAMDL
ncbi:WD40-repeat-containing domain protein, partial [Entophlyctis helioformis]